MRTICVSLLLCNALSANGADTPSAHSTVTVLSSATTISGVNTDKAPNQDQGVTEDEFELSCYKICFLFQISESDLSQAYTNIVNSEPELKTTIDLDLSLKKIGHFDQALVKNVLVEMTKAILQKNGQPAPYKNLSLLETASIIQYTGEDYKKLNEDLRKSKDQDPDTHTVADFISHSLRKLPPAVVRTVRGIDPYNGWQTKFTVGATVTERGFISTSKSLTNPPFQNSIMIYVNSKTGRDITDISAVAAEKEVLFVPGSKFKVLSVTGPSDPSSPTYEIELDDVSADSPR